MKKTPHRFPLFRVLCLFFQITFGIQFSYGQNLIQNGTFQNGITGWTTISQYWNIATASNSGCVGTLTQYLYHGNADGSWANNTFGSAYQEITIPANTTSATLQLKISVNTEETTSTQINDVIDIQFRSTVMALLHTFASFSNLHGRNAQTCKPYEIFNYNIPSQYFGQTIRLNFQGASNNTLKTVFRIDDVNLNITTAPASCVSWINGPTPSNSEVVTAANYLCERGLIDNVIDVSQLGSFPIKEACLSTILSLYNGNLPTTLQSNYYPTLFTDIENLPFEYYVSVKALCFLDYDDGRPCIRREYNQLYPSLAIEQGYTLRMLLEAWDIAPDTTGWDPYKHTPSAFACNIYYDDVNYGYFKKAAQLGLLSGYINGGCFSYANRGEFFIVMLYRLYSLYARPSISQASYHVPNNFKLTNGSVNAEVERGVFKSFEQNGFSIPSGGLGIDFDYSYHSDWLDMPTIPNSLYTSGYELLKEVRAKHKTFPVGLGWTHTYNSFAHVVRDNTGNDVFFIFKWGDGTVYIYNSQTQQFETKGIYDELTTLEVSLGRIRVFQLKTKDQLRYVFYRDNVLNSDQFILESITDRNGNRVSIDYESAVCAQAPTNCINTIDRRIKSVTDNSSNRTINFEYQSNTDLLHRVIDNSGRTMMFYVNPRTHNLDSVTNPRGYTTKYRYCNYDSCSNMLIEIQRPKGNWIKNNYAKRKLQKTQTPNYSASVNFGTNYNSSSQTTQSQIITTPSSGTTYSVSYQHNIYGQPTSATLAGSTTQIEYNDGNNPTLPTRVIDNPTGVVTSYTYDAKGNQLSQTITGGAITQFTQQWFNSNNDIVEILHPNGSKSQYGYNATGNLISETGPHGYKLLYTRNPNGTINTTTTANNVVTKFSYNSYINPSQVLIEGTNIKTEAVYDNVSRVTYIKDPLGVVSKYVYDNNDNIIQTTADTSQLKLTTSYKFDLNDNNELVVAPNGDSTKLVYDASDLLVEEKYGQQVRKWVYFEDGTLNAIQTKNGVQHWSEYYSSGSPFEGKLKIQHLTELFYDNTTKLLNRRKRFNATHHYTYDPLQRVTGVQFRDSVGASLAYASEVKYEYNNSGFQTKIDIPEVNKHFRYVPDSLNRVSQVYDWNNTLMVRYTYRADGLINTELLGNGATVFYHYDNAGRLDSMYAKSSSGTLLYSIGATLDDKGNHIAESYYVNKSSLPVITIPFPQTSINYQYDIKTNRLTQTNSLTATSDNNGNILQDNYTGFGVTGATTTYDLYDNITRCNVDGYTHNFKYDPLDIRYSVDTNTYINDFLNNGNVLVQKRTGIGVQKLYCHSPLGLVCSIDNATNQRKWYLYDFRGSTVAILDDNQNVIEYYKYEPFGSVMESSHTPGTTTPFLYVGRHGVEYQSPHLYYMRARYYDPTNGRFYGEDPVWNSNLFVYADNNPLINIDPDGTISKSAKLWKQSWNQGLSKLNESLSDTKTYDLSFQLSYIAATQGLRIPNGWKLGQPITNNTSFGMTPTWNTVRQRFWKNEALNNGENYIGNLSRLQKGLAPQRINPITGKIESMELHHILPQRKGGLFYIKKVWPDEHKLIDPFRK